MENLFISPNPDNHALAWQVFKNQPKPLLENAVQEWIDWAVKGLTAFQKELFAAFQQKMSAINKMDRHFTAKVKKMGYTFSGNASSGYAIQSPVKVDSWLFPMLQKKIDEANYYIQQYNIVKANSQFVQHDLCSIGRSYSSFNRVYEAKLLCGEITIAYQFICLEYSYNVGCRAGSETTKDFKKIFSQSSEHFAQLGNKIKSVFIYHDYENNIRAYYSNDEYFTSMRGKLLNPKKAKPHLPQLF